MKPFYDAVCWWQKERFGVETDPAWITMCPTVVSSINVAIRAFTNEGDGVIIQQPVYDPFATIVKRTKRRVVDNGLKLENGRYVMDYELLEQQASDPNTKMIVLCSPHNPVGRVWEKEELKRLCEICVRNHVLIVSDEIHADIVYEGHVHTSILSVDPAYRNQMILLSAPGKTFNIPGLKTGYAIIPDKDLHHAFNETQLDMSLDVRNTFALEGLQAAYTPDGEAWMKEELAYLQHNVEVVKNFLKDEMPEVTMIEPEGTFLCWLDFRKLGYSDQELMKRIIVDAAVVCVPGPWFGNGGQQHLRLNIGVPTDLLLEALNRIKTAIQ